MLKLLNKNGLPNVIEFELSDRKVNEIALLAGYHVNKRNFKATAKSYRNTKGNNYLAKTFRRLRKHAEQGNFEAFNKVSKMLVQRSDVYLVQCANHVLNKWTGMNFHKFIKVLG
jgi:hypothetical protein